MLVEVGGFTFLTDPNFLHQGQYAELRYGPAVTPADDPTLAVADLPADFVLLSHHHGDHFDDVAAEQLPPDVRERSGRRAQRCSFLS